MVAYDFDERLIKLASTKEYKAHQIHELEQENERVANAIRKIDRYVCLEQEQQIKDLMYYVANNCHQIDVLKSEIQNM